MTTLNSPSTNLQQSDVPFISSRRTVHIHNAVNAVCFMFSHPAVAGELQKADGAKTPHLSCQPSYFITVHTVMTTLAFNYTPAWRTNLCQHSGIFKLPAGCNILYLFFFSAKQTAKIFHKYSNHILLHKPLVNVHVHLMKTLLEEEPVVTEIFLDMIHSFSRITWIRHT